MFYSSWASSSYCLLRGGNSSFRVKLSVLQLRVENESAELEIVHGAGLARKRGGTGWNMKWIDWIGWILVWWSNLCKIIVEKMLLFTRRAIVLFSLLSLLLIKLGEPLAYVERMFLDLFSCFMTDKSWSYRMLQHPETVEQKLFLNYENKSIIHVMRFLFIFKHILH